MYTWKIFCFNENTLNYSNTLKSRTAGSTIYILKLYTHRKKNPNKLWSNNFKQDGDPLKILRN